MLLAIHDLKFEILLVDDGSTDGSGELCDSIQKEDCRVRTIHQVNQGVSAARNCGIDAASGNYIFFLDADDTVETDELLSIISIMEQNPDVDIAMFGCSLDYYKRGECYRSEAMRYSEDGILCREQWFCKLQELYQCNYLSPVWNKIIRRNLLTEHSLQFDRSLFLFEDLHFSLKCLSNCKSIYCSTLVIYHYRQAEDEGNAGRRLKRISKISSVIDNLQDAFYGLADSFGKEHDVFDDQLTDIFLMLARQKIQVSDRRTIEEVCRDLKEWLPAHNVSPETLSGQYTQKVLQQKTAWLYWRCRYSALRHWIANFVKYLRFCRRKDESHGEAASSTI